jgi:hypothetical protein
VGDLASSEMCVLRCELGMTLNAGTRLGPYEIQSAIGVGGMGEVYQATDTNLGRAAFTTQTADADKPMNTAGGHSCHDSP